MASIDLNDFYGATSCFSSSLSDLGLTGTTSYKSLLEWRSLELLKSSGGVSQHLSQERILQCQNYERSCLSKSLFGLIDGTLTRVSLLKFSFFQFLNSLPLPAGPVQLVSHWLHHFVDNQQHCLPPPFPLVSLLRPSSLQQILPVSISTFWLCEPFPSPPSCIMSNYRSQCVSVGSSSVLPHQSFLFVFACLSRAAILGALLEPWRDTSLHSPRRLIL